MSKKFIALLLIVCMLGIIVPTNYVVAAEEINFETHFGSLGWNEPYTLKVNVGDSVVQKSANVVAVSIKRLSDEYAYGNLEIVTINGETPYSVSSENEGISKYVTSSYNYVDFEAENIYYGNRVNYNGEKSLEIVFENSRPETNYMDYAIYLGFYKISAITQDEYNNATNNNRLAASDNKYYEVEELEIIGTSLQVSPVSLSYTLPAMFEGLTVSVERDTDPYTGGFQVRANTFLGGKYLPPLQAHVQGKYSEYQYTISHNVSHDLPYKTENEKKNFLEMVSVTGSSLSTDTNAERKILNPLNQTTVNQFHASTGYFSELVRYSEEIRKDSHFNASNVYETVTHTKSILHYFAAATLVMPDETVHVVKFEKNISFPAAHFTKENELAKAKGEFEQFLLSFALAPKNKGMTPQEYGDFIKGNNEFSINLVSSTVTVPNTGIYDTGTKSDSAFLPGVRINKPYDYTEKLFIVGEILGKQENPPIAFFEGSEVFTMTQATESNFVGFNMVTRGVRGGTNGGLNFDPKQKVKFTLKDTAGNTLARPVILNVNLIDVSPKIILVEGPKTAAQSGSERSFIVRVEDADDETLIMTISSPFGQVRLSGGDFKKSMQTDRSTFEDFTIGFRAPEIGNFNINTELQNLSMVALQEGTFTTLAADLQGVAMENYVNKLKGQLDEKSKVFRSEFDWNNYDQKLMAIDSIKAASQNHEKWNNINSAYGHFGNSMNAINAAKNAQLGEEIAEAMNTDNKGIFESSVDVGIASINVLQTGVGLFTSALSYVPGGRAVAGKTTLWFNLSTNVWKANLQYLSKLEKIDRAEEVLELIPVIISTEDKSGFVVRFVILVPVIGLEV